MNATRHAENRAQQRAIPPLVDRLLDEFGDEQHDGHGCIRVFFSHASIRRMERAYGRQPVGLFKRYLHAYKVESLSDGAVITRGWRTERQRRR